MYIYYIHVYTDTETDTEIDPGPGLEPTRKEKSWVTRMTWRHSNRRKNEDSRDNMGYRQESSTELNVL